MKLHPPLMISARLLPAVQIASAWLSIEPTPKGPIFYLDTDEWYNVIKDYKPSPICYGNREKNILEMFKDILGFMIANVEDRSLDLFPSHVLDWAYDHDQEIAYMSMDIDDILNPEDH